MRYGMRKPSWKKSLSARTKGRATRAIKRAIIPGYGKRGMGIFHPKRAIYNRVYRRTTFSIFDLAKGTSSNSGCCVAIAFWVIGGGTYRTMLMDDYSVYTELGKTQLRLAGSLIFVDCGNDFQDPLDTIRSNYKDYLDRLPDYRKDNFNCLNTELVIKNGLVTEIHRRWTP